MESKLEIKFGSKEKAYYDGNIRLNKSPMHLHTLKADLQKIKASIPWIRFYNQLYA